jgi:hypothetical protein
LPLPLLLAAEEFLQLWPRLRVLARCTPADKYTIVTGRGWYSRILPDDVGISLAARVGVCHTHDPPLPPACRLLCALQGCAASPAMSWR